MFALGQKRTLFTASFMSALLLKADIRLPDSMSAKCQKRTTHSAEGKHLSAP